MIERSEQESRGFVICRLGDEEYGLGIERVRSIIRYEETTPVPRAPEIVIGVINLRGQVIPVVDLTRRFARGTFEPGTTSRIVVAEGEAGVVGLAVDAANEVVQIPVASIQPTPESVLSSEMSEAFEGVAERENGLVILIDLDKAVPRSGYARATGTHEAEGDVDV